MDSDFPCLITSSGKIITGSSSKAVIALSPKGEEITL